MCLNFQQLGDVINRSACLVQSLMRYTGNVRATLNLLIVANFARHKVMWCSAIASASSMQTPPNVGPTGQLVRR